MDHALFSLTLSAFPVAAFAAVWVFIFSSAAGQPAVRAVLTFGLYEARLPRFIAAAYRRQAARRRAWRDLERRYDATAARRQDVTRHRPTPGRPPAGQHARPVYAEDGDATVVTRAYPDARHVRQEAAADVVPVVTAGGQRIAAVLAQFDAAPPRRRRPAPPVLDEADTVIVARSVPFGVAVGAAHVAAA
jgi:hypothetical protein